MFDAPMDAAGAAAALEGRFAQLTALTGLIHSEGHAALMELHEHDQSSVLWLLDDLARECRRLAGIALWGEGDHHD